MDTNTKIVGYKLVTENIIELERVVNEWIDKGWQPLGPALGVPPLDDSGGFSMFQTMILFEKPKAPKKK